MSILFRSARPEQRGINWDDIWSAPANGSKAVDPVTVGPVYAATSLIADMWASTPWGAFSDRDGIPTRSPRQPRMLEHPGGDVVDLYTWKHQGAISQLLYGNAYGYILNTDARGIPSTVMWLNPKNVNVDESGPLPVYSYKGREIARNLIIHIPMYTAPGSVKGLSPVGLFKQQFEMSAEAERVGRNFFKRGAFPPAVLKNTAKTLTPDQASEAKSSFTNSVSGSEPFVTGSDWDLQAFDLPAGEASFLTAIKATANQIAAIFRVSPEDVGGDSARSSRTYVNLEQELIKFNMRTLRPLAIRWETAFSRFMSVSHEYVRSNLDAGVRADIKSRYEAHKIALEAGGDGFLTVDEVRALEERPPEPSLRKKAQA